MRHFLPIVHSVRRPVVSIRHAEHGSMEVLLDDWVYVKVHYKYGYTDNASRHRLAEQIAAILTGKVELIERHPEPPPTE